MEFPREHLKVACERSRWDQFRSFDHLLAELARKFTSEYLIEQEEDIKSQLRCSEDECKNYSFEQHFAKYASWYRHAPESVENQRSASWDGSRRNSDVALAHMGPWRDHGDPPITEILALGNAAPDAIKQRAIHERRNVRRSPQSLYGTKLTAQ
ncbi:hypothetical protein VTN77DRAFT_8185 [Rasamsonia byssochlamydoides]|uniref:uncharacterized protein n=1 Tax=Rasamsonia byssochlamydoides TaxID=89139 RepID=UPI0037440431